MVHTDSNDHLWCTFNKFEEANPPSPGSILAPVVRPRRPLHGHACYNNSTTAWCAHLVKWVCYGYWPCLLVAALRKLSRHCCCSCSARGAPLSTADLVCVCVMKRKHLPYTHKHFPSMVIRMTAKAPLALRDVHCSVKSQGMRKPSVYL